jgi:hypothetical protein
LLSIQVVSEPSRKTTCLKTLESIRSTTIPLPRAIEAITTAARQFNTPLALCGLELLPGTSESRTD